MKNYLSSSEYLHLWEPGRNPTPEAHQLKLDRDLQNKKDSLAFTYLQDTQQSEFL